MGKTQHACRILAGKHKMAIQNMSPKKTVILKIISHKRKLSLFLDTMPWRVKVEIHWTLPCHGKRLVACCILSHFFLGKESLILL